MAAERERAGAERLKPDLFLAIVISNSWAAAILAFLRGLGPLGFFALETLNCSFFYVPLATELLLVAAARDEPGALMWAAYVLMAAGGSALGTLLLDVPARKIGEKGLENYVKPKQVRRIKKHLEQHARWALMVAAALPPPFPFRATIITAAALQSPRRRMLLSVFCGRACRFGIEAALAVYFGRQFLRYLRSDVLDYIIYALLAIGIVGSIFTLAKWLTAARRERQNKRTGGRAQDESVAVQAE